MWVVTFIQDTEITGVGSVTASNEGFTFTKRVNTNSVAEVDSFVAETKTKFLGTVNIQNTVESIAEVIQAKFNI